jgi:DNA-binding CsgD family transcriptional regulator/PAS domain-containing protein
MQDTETTTGTLLSLIELAYDAASDPGRWTNLLQALSTALRCELVAFDLRDSETYRAKVQCHVGPYDATLKRGYETYYAERNIFLRARPDLTFSGAIRNCEAIVPDRDAVKSEYFNDFLRRIGVLHGIGMVPVREGPVMTVLSLMRRIGAPSFTDRDIAFLGRFMPHLQRATLIQRRLRGVDLERAAASEAVDRLPYGVVILDETGQILFVNAAGEEMLAEGDGLRTVGGRLSAIPRREADALRHLVAKASAPPGRLPEGAAGFLQVSRPSGQRDFALLIAPLRLDMFALTNRRPAAIVFITDPERAAVGVEAILRRLFALTPAEAEVTAQLLRGRSLEEIRAELGTSVHTTRTHLKRVFAKTGTRSQAELVRVILRSPAELRTSQGGRTPRG